MEHSILLVLAAGRLGSGHQNAGIPETMLAEVVAKCREIARCTRNPTLRATSWLRLDGADCVGVDGRNKSDLVRSVTKNQI